MLVAPPDAIFGGFVAGETHPRHVVTIGAGDDIVITLRNADGVVDQDTVNGLQIVPGLPEAVEPETRDGTKTRSR